MSHVIKLEQFEGPLDLLLQLTENQELDISEVSLSQVTDQYVIYIQEADIDPHEIADFLSVAARLLLIKSKILLPFFETESDEDQLDLAEQLKVYSQYIEISKVLDTLWKQHNVSYSRIKLQIPKNDEQEFVPPPNVDASVLHEAFTQVVERIRPIIKLPEKTLKKVVSLKERIEYLSSALLTKKSFHFSETLTEKNNQELIVTFLALLELVKQRRAVVAQHDGLGDIYIEQYDNS